MASSRRRLRKRLYRPPYREESLSGVESEQKRSYSHHYTGRCKARFAAADGHLNFYVRLGLTRVCASA